jgi:hypothetical protein
VKFDFFNHVVFFLIKLERCNLFSLFLRLFPKKDKTKKEIVAIWFPNPAPIINLIDKTFPPTKLLVS